MKEIVEDLQKKLSLHRKEELPVKLLEDSYLEAVLSERVKKTAQILSSLAKAIQEKLNGMDNYDGSYDEQLRVVSDELGKMNNSKQYSSLKECGDSLFDLMNNKAQHF